MDHRPAPLRLDHLPPEVLLLCLASLASSQLVQLALVSSAFTRPAQALLFNAPRIATLEQFDALLLVLDPPPSRERIYRRRTSISRTEADVQDPETWQREDGEKDHGWAPLVHDLRIQCMKLGQRGWGQRIGRLLKVCTGVGKVEISGVDDLKAKFLVGAGCESLSFAFCDQCRADPLLPLR